MNATTLIMLALLVAIALVVLLMGMVLVRCCVAWRLRSLRNDLAKIIAA
jgi:hypothetical protein